MPSVTLNAYEVQIRKRRESESREVLSDFNNGNSFNSFLYETITKWSYEGNDQEGILEDSLSNKRLRVRRNTIKTLGNKTELVIETGEYGYESQVVNSTGENTKRILKDESPMLPFYFSSYIPENKLSGILLFQKFKNLGAFGVFSKSLKSEFRSVNPEYILDINPLSSPELIDRLFDEGVVRKISFRKFIDNRPVYLDEEREPIMENQHYYSEYNLVAKRRQQLNISRLLRSWRSGNDRLDQLVPIRDFEYNEIFVNLKLFGNQRTINLSKIDDLGAFFDISGEVDFDDDTGLPTIESIEQASDGILSDIIRITDLS